MLHCAKDKNILRACSILIILIIISYYFIDKPVAYWAFANIRFSDFSNWLILATHLPVVYGMLCPWVFIFVIISYKKFQINNQYRYLAVTVVLMVISLLLAEKLCLELKILFGRYWPATWYQSNNSLIRDGAYGFTWLQTNRAYHSFPSSHTSIILAAMSMLSLRYNNRAVKIFALINCLIATTSLILLCYHFVSDILAGVLVGLLSAYSVLFGFNNFVKLSDVEK
jgi:membrane-associated phospholipid phosphatase